MTINLSTHSAWTLFLPLLFVSPFYATAQCSDGVTTTLWHNGNVQRSASNQVWSWAQSYVTGAYSGTWDTVTSAITAHNGIQTHSGQDWQAVTKFRPYNGTTRRRLLEVEPTRKQKDTGLLAVGVMTSSSMITHHLLCRHQQFPLQRAQLLVASSGISVICPVTRR